MGRYFYEGEKVGQGKEAAKEFIKSNPELKEELETKLRASMAPQVDETLNEEIEENKTEIAETQEEIKE